MSFFASCKTEKEARTLYVKLAKIHHPDKGGDVKVMQQINAAFDEFKKGNKSTFTQAGRNHGKTYRWQAGGFGSYSQDFDWQSIYEREKEKLRKQQGERDSEKMRKAAEDRQHQADASRYANYKANWFDDDIGEDPFESKAYYEPGREKETAAFNDKADADLKARMEKLRQDAEKVKEKKRKEDRENAKKAAKERVEREAKEFAEKQSESFADRVMREEYARIADAVNDLVSARLASGRYSTKDFMRGYIVLGANDIKKILERK